MNTRSETSFAGVFAGVILFILWGLSLISLEIPHEWEFPMWVPGIFLISTIFVLPIGMCIGWIHGFPRWSYPYVGHVLVFSLYMMNVATPGFLFDKEPWGWRAWIPFLMITGIALLLTRSPDPIFKFFRNIWKDWTLLTFTMLGFMPLLVAIAFDEMDRLYSLYFMILVAILMCVTAFFYLKARVHRQKVMALSIGILLITVIAVVAPTLYWQRNGFVNPWGMVITSGIVILFMLSPAFIGVLSRLVSRNRLDIQH